MPSVFILPSAPFFRQLITVLITISSLLAGLPPPTDYDYHRNAHCLDYCKLHKPVDFDEPFALNCSNENFSEEEKTDCDTTCLGNCRYRYKNLCNVDGGYYNRYPTGESRTINCPANSTPVPEMGIDCQNLCDSHRPNDFDGSYPLHCEDLDYYREVVSCKTNCLTFCKQFCDIQQIEREPSVINCPSAVLSDGPCKQRCDYQRNVRNDSFLGNFTFHCANYTLFPTEWEQRFCLKDCYDCPYTICSLNVRYSYDDGEFSCPAVQAMPPRPPSPPTEPVYEGSDCEKRCEKGRAYERRRDGDRDSYVLDCNSERYGYDEEERQQCYDDCSSCPLDVCYANFEKDFGLYANDKTSPDYVDERYRTVYFQCPDSRPTPTPGRAKPGRYIVAWVIIGLVAVAIIACIVSAVMYGRMPSAGGNICRGAKPQAAKPSHVNADSAFNSHCSVSSTLVSSVSLQPPAP